MAETYSAGIVTAYGAAVRGGYTGTYEEFCTEQAGFAENAQQVAEDRAATEQLVSDFGTVTVPAAEQQIAAAGVAQVAAVNAAGQDKETDIAAAGAAQVTRVETTGTQTVGSVEAAGSQQVAAVNAAGSAQVAAVAAEGTTQTGAVQAKGQEVLDSIPEDYTSLVDEVAVIGDARGSLSDRINVLHQLVDYGYADEDLAGSPDQSIIVRKLDVSRRNTQVVLNLASGVDSVLYVKLSGSLARAASSGAVNAWDTGLTLEEGHKYRVYLALISGTVAGDNPPAVSVYKTGEHLSIGDVVANDNNTYIREFTAPATEVNLAIYVYRQTTLINAKYQVVLEDITDSIDGTSLRNDIEAMADDIAELKDDVTDLESVSNQLNLHTKPQSVGAYNVIRRARQLTDAEWVPAENNKMRREYYIPSESYEETRTLGLRDVTQFFRSDEKYVGIPYSEWHDVGTDIGIETCITSIMTPKSVMMAESGPIRDMGSTYYGVSCSTLVCYALALPHISTDVIVRIKDGVLDPISGLSFVQDIVVDGVNQNLDGLELADILWVDGHCAMVTDLIKSDGHVTDIEVSESSMTYLGYARRWMWKIDDFYRWFSVFKVFRYSKLDEIGYTPNIYAPLANEGTRNRYTNYNVIPYLGNKCFVVPDGGASMKLVVKNVEDLNRGNPPETLAYSHILLIKDGVVFGDPIEIDVTKGTEPYVTDDIALDVDEATYNACLVAISNGEIVKRSKECEWCVMPQHTPTITYSNRLLTITVTVKNKSFAPQYFASTRYNEVSWRTSKHITPDMMAKEENLDGSVTYTIVYEYDSDAVIANIGIGYTSPEYGTVRETYAYT